MKTKRIYYLWIDQFACCHRSQQCHADAKLWCYLKGWLLNSSLCTWWQLGLWTGRTLGYERCLCCDMMKRDLLPIWQFRTLSALYQEFCTKNCSDFVQKVCCLQQRWRYPCAHYSRHNQSKEPKGSDWNPKTITLFSKLDVLLCFIFLKNCTLEIRSAALLNLSDIVATCLNLSKLETEGECKTEEIICNPMQGARCENSIRRSRASLCSCNSIDTKTQSTVSFSRNDWEQTRRSMHSADALSVTVWLLLVLASPICANLAKPFWNLEEIV